MEFKATGFLQWSKNRQKKDKVHTALEIQSVLGAVLGPIKINDGYSGFKTLSLSVARKCRRASFASSLIMWRSQETPMSGGGRVNGMAPAHVRGSRVEDLDNSGGVLCMFPPPLPIIPSYAFSNVSQSTGVPPSSPRRRPQSYGSASPGSVSSSVIPQAPLPPPSSKITGSSAVQDLHDVSLAGTLPLSGSCIPSPPASIISSHPFTIVSQSPPAWGLPSYSPTHRIRAPLPPPSKNVTDSSVVQDLHGVSLAGTLPIFGSCIGELRCSGVCF